jgi:hypothetical protein
MIDHESKVVGIDRSSIYLGETWVMAFDRGNSL